VPKSHCVLPAPLWRNGPDLPHTLASLVFELKFRLSHVRIYQDWSNAAGEVLRCGPPTLRKIAKSDYYLRPACLVCPSVRPFAWNDSVPTGRIFVKFDIWVFFRKSVKETQVSLKSDKNNGYFTWRRMYCTLMIIPCSVLLRVINALDESYREKQNTRFKFSIFFPRKSCSLWDTKSGTRPHGSTMRRVRIACWITKATYTRYM